MKETILNFQNQCIKLFNLGLNRKKFEINATIDKFFNDLDKSERLRLINEIEKWK